MRSAPSASAHVWVGKTWSGGDRPKETPPVPGRLHWDLWLGPAPERPYHPTYLPANWRRWWDFGSGTLGDMACHYMDLPFWALDLKHPLSAEAEGPPVHPETTPSWMIVRYEFPSRGDMPPVNLTWYDGGKRPELFSQGKLPRWGDGVLFVGDKGMLLADYDRYVLLPEADFKDFRPPAPSIAKSIGHHNEWIDACKTGRPTTCNFGYSGALTEAVLLGAVAYPRRPKDRLERRRAEGRELLRGRPLHPARIPQGLDALTSRDSHLWAEKPVSVLSLWEPGRTPWHRLAWLGIVGGHGRDCRPWRAS